MKPTSGGALLRIFIGETDQWQGGPLYEEILFLAKKMNIKGVTIVKGFMGFGAKSHLHSAKFLRLSENLPIVIEIADCQEPINQFLGSAKDMLKNKFVTRQSVDILGQCTC